MAVNTQQRSPEGLYPHTEADDIATQNAEKAWEKHSETNPQNTGAIALKDETLLDVLKDINGPSAEGLHDTQIDLTDQQVPDGVSQETRS